MADNLGEREAVYPVRVRRKTWLSNSAFELSLEKPAGFSFRPGQKVLCEVDGITREYSLASAPEQNDLIFCVRYLGTQGLSAKLSRKDTGDTIKISQAYGFFVYRPGKAVFIATGTGIAPFVAYVRSGVRDFILLHGVRRKTELFYRSLVSGAAGLYVPCLSDEARGESENLHYFAGRVTKYLAEELQEDQYDFYLSGNGAMVRDALGIIDAKFAGSRVFTETFYDSGTG